MTAKTTIDVGQTWVVRDDLGRVCARRSILRVSEVTVTFNSGKHMSDITVRRALFERWCEDAELLGPADKTEEP